MANSVRPSRLWSDKILRSSAIVSTSLALRIALVFFIGGSLTAAQAEESNASASPAAATTSATTSVKTATTEKYPAFLAKVFDAESHKQKMLFTYRQTSKTEPGLHVITNTYYDPEQKVVAIEETTLAVAASGAESLKGYKMDQKQLNTVGVIEIKNGQADFNFTRDGKTKTSDEKANEDFVVGPTITQYLQRHWAQIAAGDHLKMRFAVVDRVETVGFELFKQEEEQIDNKPVWTIKMKPSSFLIAALVKPLFFFYTPDGQRLVEVHGRTQVKENVEGKLKDLDAVTTFEYPADHSPDHSPSEGNTK